MYREPSGHWGGICATRALNVQCISAERGLSVLARPELRSESVLGQLARLLKRVSERKTGCYNEQGQHRMSTSEHTLLLPSRVAVHLLSLPPKRAGCVEVYDTGGDRRDASSARELRHWEMRQRR